MTRIVSPEEFAAAFDPVVSCRESDIATRWWTAKEYSGLFLDSEEGILQEVAQALGLAYWREYLKIDAVFYERVDDVDSLAVAVEHENDANSSSWEANKLSLLNAPLKVLITYPKKGSDEPELLSSYAEVLRRADVFDDFATLRRQLVVFAVREDEVVAWRYHVYARRGFEPLEVAP